MIYDPEVLECWQAHLSAYASCFTAPDGFGYLFFTDPHLIPDRKFGTRFPSEKAVADLSFIKAVFDNTPARYVLCGGDWIAGSYTAQEAVMLEGRIPNLMRGLISERSYTVIGNHDMNAEAPADRALRPWELARLWFGRNVGYYDIPCENTVCYMFDSGCTYARMNDYKWEQIAWFASRLLGSVHDHHFGLIHVPDRAASTQGINLTTKNITLIADAFNRKTSVTLNDRTWDFSRSRGTFHYLLGGHFHHDRELVMNNIPLLCSIGFLRNRSLDLCYADYGAAVLRMVRIGSGNSRIIGIIPNGGYHP